MTRCSVLVLVAVLAGILWCFAELGETSTDGVRVLKYFRGMFRQFEGIVTPPLTAPNA